MMTLALLLPLLLSTVAAERSTLLLRDHSGKSLSSSAGRQQLTAEGVAATLSTLAGSSVLTIDQKAAAQVSALLPEGLLNRPDAVLSVHIVGADTGRAELAGWAAHSVAKCCNTNRLAESLTWASVHSPSLDCGEQCMERGLQALASLSGGQYSAGRLSLTAVGGGSVGMDMNGAEEQVWAAELATALNEAQAAIGGGGRRQYAFTLVGLQALALKHGASSPKAQAALATTMAAVARIDELLAARHADSLVSMVVVSPEVELSQPSLASLLRWREQQHQQRASTRLLLADSSLGAPAYQSNDNATSVHDMTVKTSAWVAGITLLVFLAGALCCMYNMDFKKDSLLFGVQKARID